jgi:hypothetical protein
MKTRPHTHGSRRALGALALLALAGLAGCASSAQQPMHADARTNDALVLPPLAPDEFAGWEFDRNNGFINFQPDAVVRPYGFVEVYTRDRFYNHGNRGRESSRYEIRSYRIR